jgi:CelD/BcsL family acetyltransferase involved in cellulose biosynthesis
MITTTAPPPATNRPTSECDDARPPSPKGVSARIATALRDLPALEASWTVLRDRYGATSPNAEPQIFAATVSALGQASQPYIALFEDGADPRAIIIARRSDRPFRCRLGYLPLRSPRLRGLDIVYGGLITDGSDGAKRAVCDHLRALLRTRRIDHLMINHLPLTHELFSSLIGLRGCDRASLRGRFEPHWRFTLADGPFENTLRRFSRKHRYNLRRTDRLLAERFGGDLRLRRITGARDVRTFIGEALRITGAGYQAAIGAGIGNPDVQEGVLHAAAAGGQLRCYLLLGAGRAIAFQSGVVCRGVYHLQSTAFLPEFGPCSPGRALLVRVLEDLCAAGVGIVDYGFGDARYKQIYGNECREEATVHLWANTPVATSARMLHRFATAANHRAAALTRRFGVLDTIRSRWRGRLAGG